MPPQSHAINATPDAHKRHMILGVGRTLIKHLNRFPTQLDKISLKRQIANARLFGAEIVLDEQRQAVRVPK